MVAARDQQPVLLIELFYMKIWCQQIAEFRINNVNNPEGVIIYLETITIS